MYACERPVSAANPRSDKPRSVFMMLSRYASANVRWLGAASATAADGVSGARLAFTAVGSPEKFTSSSPYHKDRCRTNRSVTDGHSLQALSASFRSVVHRCKLIHTLKFRFSLTSNSGGFSPAISMHYTPRLLPNGRASPTKRTERLLPNGRTSPTKRTEAKNPRRFGGLPLALPVKRGSAVGWRRCCGVGLLPNGRAGFLPTGGDLLLNGRRSPTKRTGLAPTKPADAYHYL